MNFGSSFVFGQSDFASSFFEFGENRIFQGRLEFTPYPHLLVKRPGISDSSAIYSSYLLVAPFKFGLKKSALEKIKEIKDVLGDGDLDHRQVVLEGSLIYRDKQAMIEVVSGSIKVLKEKGNSKNTAKSQAHDYNSEEVMLKGEIVDSKCYLGVMKPAIAKIHRSCAIRCISGGLPPLFVSTDPKAGKYGYFLLVSHEGKAVNKEILDFVAKPIEITGKIEKKGNFLILKANPNKIRTL